VRNASNTHSFIGWLKVENWSSPIKICSLPSKLTEIPQHDLSHACVYRTLVEATNHKAPQESHAVRPRTPSPAPPEAHLPAGEFVHTEVDMPHADVDVDANTASSPLSVRHPPVTMIHSYHHPTNACAPCLCLQG